MRTFVDDEALSESFSLENWRPATVAVGGLSASGSRGGWFSPVCLPSRGGEGSTRVGEGVGIGRGGDGAIRLQISVVIRLSVCLKLCEEVLGSGGGW